jgi:tetratricopeptide (TPR) repeat protein
VRMANAPAKNVAEVLATPPNRSTVNIAKEADNDPLIVAAERAMKLERYGAALKLYETLEIMHPNYTRAIKGKAEALRAMGRDDAAQKEFQRVQVLNPHDSDVEGAIVSLGYAKDPNKSLEMLFSKFRREPENANLAAQIGMAYAQLGEFENSYNFLRRATNLSPTRVAFMYNLAVASDNLGKYSEAISYYQKALTLNAQQGERTNFDRSNVFDRINALREFSQ